MNLEERIRLEEITRHKVQKELNKFTLWNFLNSSFGLWVLSTFILGLFTYGYHRYQELNIHKIEADRLEIELRHRLTLFNKSIKTLSKEINEVDNETDPWGLKFASKLRYHYQYVQKPESAFFSNYANDNVQSLFIGLQDKLRDADVKKSASINDCLIQLKEIRKLCEDEYHNVPRPDNPKVYKQYFEQIRFMIDGVDNCLSAKPLSQWSQ